MMIPCLLREFSSMHSVHTQCVSLGIPSSLLSSSRPPSPLLHSARSSLPLRPSRGIPVRSVPDVITVQEKMIFLKQLYKLILTIQLSSIMYCFLT